MMTRKSLADTIDAYDDQIAELQASKRETFQGYREQLAAAMGKDEVKLEIEATKAAIKRRRAIREKGEEVVDHKDALADEIFDEITTSNAPRATRVEIIEKFDPETGEFIKVDDLGNADPIPGNGAGGAEAVAPVGNDGATASAQPLQAGSGPAEAHNLGQAGSTPAPATHTALRVDTDQAEPDDRGGAPQAPSATVVPDRNKPHPWCKDPEDCGVHASWEHMCLSCHRAGEKAQREQAEAVH